MPGNPVTHRTIARTCGFGQSTVSMALRNDPRLPEATRRAIQETARMLGYHPNPHLSRLMSGVKRRRVENSLQPLAYVILWDQPEIHDAYYHTYRSGAQARAAEFGYELHDFVVGAQGITLKRLATIVRAQAIPGMLIAPVDLPHRNRGLGQGLEGRAIALPSVDHAIATIGYSLSSPAVNRATHDHAQGARTAVARLRDRGFRRIGLVSSRDIHVRVEGHWASGFLLAQHELPPADRLEPLILDEIHDAPAFDRWLDRERPEVLLTNEVDELRRHLERRGRRVPQDIGLVNLNAGEAKTPYAGIDQRAGDVGGAALDLLLAQILRNERGLPPLRKTVMIEGVWQDGPTLPSPRSR